MSEHELKYERDTARDIVRVLQGTKPIVVIEHYKSASAYNFARSLLFVRSNRNLILASDLVDLLTPHGDKQAAVVLAQYWGDINDFRHLLEIRASMTREQFQAEMGAALGYSNAEIKAFIASETGRTCACELCGGPLNEHL